MVRIFPDSDIFYAMLYVKCLTELSKYLWVWKNTSVKNTKQPPEIFCKNGVLRNFTKFTGKHLSQNLCKFFKKETLAQMFSCQFCEISKNAFFTEHLRVPAALKTV